MATTTSKSSSQYKHLSQRDQILKRPGMYIGSTKLAKQDVWLAVTGVTDGKQTETITQQTIDYVAGLIHIFYEVLSNAQDNYFRSCGSQHHVKKIEITVTDTTVTICNDGLWIPTIIHQWEKDEEKLPGEHYEAEIIFGHLNSSGNYEDTTNRRLGLGLHGVGVKLTNLFSRQFTIETFDPETHLKFYQKYTNNMTVRSKPKVTKLKKTKGYTKVSYVADFARFGVEGYSSEMIAVMRKLAIDCAMVTTGVKIVFNGVVLPVKNLLAYTGYYTDTSKLEFKSSNSTMVLCEKPGFDRGLSQVSFVNGGLTSKGGVHVDLWLRAVMKPLLDRIRAKHNKPKGSTPIKITAKNLHDYFYVFINCNVENPEFEGQQKHVYLGPATCDKCGGMGKRECVTCSGTGKMGTLPEIHVPKSKIDQLLKWSFMEDIAETVRIQNMKELKKTDGKKTQTVAIPKADDANKAGGRLSSECTLIITEGLSAKTFAVTGISAISQGADFYGVLPVRGKVLNVRNASAKQINNNKEISQLKVMLGLQHGMVYTDDANFKKLRYGRVCLLTDSDLDGVHIQGLIMNFFQTFYPCLIRRGYIRSMRTPIVKATCRKKVFLFHHLSEFKDWAKKQSQKSQPYKAQYYKGLGTSDDAEVIDAFQQAHYVQYTKDPGPNLTEDTIDLVFGKKRADDRKKWLAAYEPKEFSYPEENGEETVRISQFISNEFIEFSLYDNTRSIPSVVDGLKPSQRKAMWVALSNLNTRDNIKLAQFAAKVSEKSEYHHGEKSLEDAIKGLCQDFVGSNNVPLLTGKGQFGSRLEGGADAASARYIFLRQSELTRFIFRKEDDAILEYLEEEGKSIEPKFFVPVVPILLVNGSIGIGTGYSTNIPAYKPEDLVAWIRCWLRSETAEYPELTPWYFGFSGQTRQIGTRVTHTGVLEESKNGYEVKELPVRVWVSDYKESLQKLKEAKHIRDYSDHKPSPYTVHFTVYPRPGVDLTIESLKLMSTEHTSNMTAFTPIGALKTFSGINELLAEYCTVRYQFYEKRKKHLIRVLKNTLKEQISKETFLRAALKNRKLLEQTEIQLFEYLEKHEYYKKAGSYRYLTDMPIRSFTTDKLEQLVGEIQATRCQIDYIKQTSPKKMWLTELAEFLTAYNKWKTAVTKFRANVAANKIKLPKPRKRT